MAARLLVVTGFLQHTRAGGQGAFVGAAVFPVLALAFAVRDPNGYYIAFSEPVDATDSP